MTRGVDIWIAAILKAVGAYLRKVSEDMSSSRDLRLDDEVLHIVIIAICWRGAVFTI